MAEGFVYLLTSINSPHVKIGGTEHPPSVRVRDINGSPAYGALGPWLLSDFRHVHDWRLVERLLHDRFATHRIADVEGTRELFAVAASDGRGALAEVPHEHLVRADEIDRMFQHRALALYLERLFCFSGLGSWLHMQGAWTLRLFPSTAGGRYFTLNIGGHEVAWSPLPRRGAADRHAVVVDKLIEDFSEVRLWLAAHDGAVHDAEYKSSYGRAVVLDFAGDWAEAEHVFALPGVRRALVALSTCQSFSVMFTVCGVMMDAIRNLKAITALDLADASAGAGGRKMARGSPPSILTVADIRARLPIVISDDAVRKKLRASGLALEHRRQLFLPADRFPKFLEMFACSSSSSARSERRAASRSSGTSKARVSSPGTSSEQALAAIRRAMRKSS